MSVEGLREEFLAWPWSMRHPTDKPSKQEYFDQVIEEEIRSAKEGAWIAGFEAGNSTHEDLIYCSEEWKQWNPHSKASSD